MPLTCAKSSLWPCPACPVRCHLYPRHDRSTMYACIRPPCLRNMLPIAKQSCEKSFQNRRHHMRVLHLSSHHPQIPLHHLRRSLQWSSSQNDRPGTRPFPYRFFTSNSFYHSGDFVDLGLGLPRAARALIRDLNLQPRSRFVISLCFYSHIRYHRLDSIYHHTHSICFISLLYHSPSSFLPHPPPPHHFFRRLFYCIYPNYPHTIVSRIRFTRVPRPSSG